MTRPRNLNDIVMSFRKKSFIFLNYSIPLFMYYTLENVVLIFMFHHQLLSIIKYINAEKKNSDPRLALKYFLLEPSPENEGEYQLVTQIEQLVMQVCALSVSVQTDMVGRSLEQENRNKIFQSNTSSCLQTPQTIQASKTPK